MSPDTVIRDKISREMPYIMSLAAALDNKPYIVCSDGIRAKLDRTLMLTRILKYRELDS